MCECSILAPVWEDANEYVSAGEKKVHTVQYNTCPAAFVPESVGEFLRRYLYRQEYKKTAPPLESLSNRFIQAMECFESARNHFALEQQQNQKRGV